MTTPMHDFVDNAECPGCGARSTLDPEHAYPNARVCGACRGWFLERDTAYRFLVEEMTTATEDVARMLATPGVRRRRCPACDRDTSAVVIHSEDVDLCAGCGGAWLAPGVMGRLSRGRFGAEGAPTGALTTPAQRGAVAALVADPVGGSPAAPPPPNPFGLPLPERPPSPFGPPGSVLPPPVAALPPRAAVPAAAVAPAGGGLELARPLRSQEGAPVVERSVPSAAAPPPVSAARAASVTSAAGAIADGARPQGATGAALPARARLPLVLVGGALLVVASVGAGLVVFSRGDDDVAKEKEPDATAKYAAFLRHYRFGGRHLDWWSARLTELAPGGAAQDAKLFTLTKDRAQRLGLVIDEQPGRIDVQLSEPLAARLLERLEVR